MAGESIDLRIRQEGMFGCTVDALRQMVGEASSPAMAAMSLLSDAQEEIALGHAEDARQTINRAKWIISTNWLP